ncbi:MAG: phage holin family protein [Bacteroidetes bacterium]|nr:phage holin family protein [Bacteroidota bacterium]
MNFIIKLLISSFAVLITAYFLDGVTIGNNQFYSGGSPELNKFSTALLVAVVLAFLNTIVKPILTILSLPITFFTLGLFLLVINAIIILFADKLVDGFKVDGFWTALWFSLVLSLVSGLLEMFTRKKEEE